MLSTTYEEWKANVPAHLPVVSDPSGQQKTEKSALHIDELYSHVQEYEAMMMMGAP